MVSFLDHWKFEKGLRLVLRHIVLPPPVERKRSQRNMKMVNCARLHVLLWHLFLLITAPARRGAAQLRIRLRTWGYWRCREGSKQLMKAGKSSKVWKWIGYATAVLSLIAGIRQLGKMISDRAQAHRRIEILLSSEGVQLQGRDYWSAWRSLEQASQIDPDSTKVHAAQETLAMEWLENVRLQENEKFSDIAEKLEPVLTRGVASSKPGPKQADLLAHIGWTYFLRSREGRLGVDPAEVYAKAVGEDPTNPYAQAMWGHWILWNHGKLSDAAPRFASALATNRQGDYVRRLQLSALFNCRSDECEEEIVRVATAMRKEQRSVGPEARSQIFSMYYQRFIPPGPATAPLVNAVPPLEHIATFRWLFDSLDLDESKSLLRTYCLAVLLEAAGQNAEALANYRLLRTQLARQRGPVWDAAGTGIQRLSRTK